MSDEIQVNLFSVKRQSDEKGFNVAVFPGAPYGYEVVLDLRPGEVETSAEVKGDPLGEREPAMLIIHGGVQIVMDLATVSEICDALRFYEMSQRDEAKELQ